MKELKQKSFLSSREFYLKKSGIRVITKNWKENLEYSIGYEELDFDLVKKREKGALLPTIGLSILFFVSLYFMANAFLQEDKMVTGLLWLGAAVVSLALTAVAYEQTNRDLIFLTGGTKLLELYRDKPNAAEVDAFILSIHTHIQEHIKRKYGKVEEHLPQDLLLERFGWLLEMGILSEEEHEELYMQVQIKDLLS